jgi:hypothetical protein
MAKDIIIDMVADYVSIFFDELTSKAALYKEGIFTIGPPEIRSAISNMKNSGDRIRIPNFELNRNPWENAIIPQDAAGDTRTYTATNITMRDEYGIVTRRRKRFEWNKVDDWRRVWGNEAEIEIARQLAESVIYDVWDEALHSVLKGAIPSSNEKDFTTATGSTTYLTPERIVEAAQSVLGDNMDNVDVLIMHSAVWSRLRQSAYSTYNTSTLINATETGRPGVWMADNKVVYVTDKCPSVTESGETKYTSYLLTRNTLSITPSQDFRMIVDPELTENEIRYMRGDTDFIPHLAGMEYKNTAPIFPKDSDLANHNNWQLGRYPNADMLKVVRVITN